MTLSVPKEKINILQSLINIVLSEDFASVKDISRIASRIISMSPAIGPISRLMTRNQYRFIESRVNWHKRERLPQLVAEELTFWSNSIESCNGFTIKHKPSPDKIVFSDASDTGYGGYVVQNKGYEIASGSFSDFQSSFSSTHRELLVVKFVIQSLNQFLSGKTVLIQTDNLNASRIIKIGSTKPHLQQEAIAIYNFCVSNDIELQSQWVTRGKFICRLLF